MTTKKQKLLDSYETLLTSLDIRVEEGGALTHDITDTPIIIEGKRLTFPSNEVLKDLNSKQIVAFHPLSENVYANMSQVLVQLRYMVSAKLHRIISGMGYVLSNCVVNAAAHNELSDNQMKIIAPLSNVDSSFLSKYVDLVDSLEVQGDPRLVSLYVKRGGELKDKKYTRMVGVSFPLIEHIMTTDDPVINGVKFRKKDIAILRALFDIVIPNAGTFDYYSVGSNSPVAPYLMALLKAYANVLQGTAGIAWDFRGAAKDSMGYSLHVKAADILAMTEGDTSLANYTGLIPALPGNTGDGDINNPATDDGEVKEKATARESRKAANVAPPTFARGGYNPPEPTRTRAPEPEPEPVRTRAAERPEYSERPTRQERPRMNSSQRTRPPETERREEEVFIRGTGWVPRSTLGHGEVEEPARGRGRPTYNELAAYDPYERVGYREERLPPRHRGGRRDYGYEDPYAPTRDAPRYR